jgi:hypothetical protein
MLKAVSESQGREHGKPEVDRGLVVEGPGREIGPDHAAPSGDEAKADERGERIEGAGAAVMRSVRAATPRTSTV